VALLSRHDPERGFETVMDLELIKDITEMSLDGLRADKNLLADFFIRQTFGHQTQDLQLSFRQSLKCVVSRRTEIERLALRDPFEIGSGGQFPIDPYFSSAHFLQRFY
jgi:hypothetical protein